MATHHRRRLFGRRDAHERRPLRERRIGEPERRARHSDHGVRRKGSQRAIRQVAHLHLTARGRYEAVRPPRGARVHVRPCDDAASWRAARLVHLEPQTQRVRNLARERAAGHDLGGGRHQVFVVRRDPVHRRRGIVATAGIETHGRRGLVDGIHAPHGDESGREREEHTPENEPRATGDRRPHSAEIYLGCDVGKERGRKRFHRIFSVGCGYCFLIRRKSVTVVPTN